MKNLYLISIILLTTISSGLCLNNPLEIVGKNSGLPGEFSTELGFNARNLGMGKTGVGDAYDSSVIYYNPAGLGFLNYAEASIMYSLLYATGKYYTVGYIHPFSQKDTMGIGICGVLVDDIKGYDSFGFLTGNNFSYSDNSFLIGYSHRMSKKLCVGVNLKIASQIFDTKNDFGVGLDLGVSMKLNRFFQWGMVVQNMGGPSLTLEAETEKYPFNVKLGTSTTLLSDHLHFLADIGAVDIFNYSHAQALEFKNYLRYHIGLEYFVFEPLPLRAGWDGSEIDAGLGFGIRKFNIDYAFAIHTLNLSHRFSFRVRFDVPATKKEIFLDERERYINIKFYLTKADDYIKNNQIEKAKSELQKAQQVPEDLKSFKEEITAKLLKAENTQKAKGLLREVQNLYDDAQYTEASKKIEEVFTLCPDDAEAKLLSTKIVNAIQADENYKTAMLSFAKKDYAAAADKIRLSLKLFPEKEEYKQFETKLKPYVNQLESMRYYNIAKTSLEKKYYERAYDEINKALDLNPENSDAMALKSQILYEHGLNIYNDGLEAFNKKDYNVVIDICNRIIDLGGNNEKFISEPFQNIILKANQLMNKANSQNHVVLAKSLLENKKYAEAEKELIQALNFDPDNQEAKEMYDRLKQIKEFYK